MLLLKTVNAVKDKLPILDMVTHPLIAKKAKKSPEAAASAAAAEDFANLLRDEISNQIKQVFHLVDQEVQRGSLPTALSGAAGSIVIVTRYNLIVAYMGNVRVLTYDQDLKTTRITDDHSRHNVSIETILNNISISTSI